MNEERSISKGRNEKRATIDPSFITEETEAEDGETFQQHQLEWKSQGMCVLRSKTTLTQFRVIEQVSKGSRQMIQEVKQEGTFKAKPRVPSSPMQLVPLSYPS